jgi:phage-related protein (TIGR01555 family)
MLDWFRRKAAPDTVTEPDAPEPRTLTGALRTEYRPGESRMALLARAQADTIQVAPVGGAMDSAKDAARLNALNITDTQLAFYASQNFIGYQTMAMLAQNWLVAKACDQPGKDAVRKGWTVTANGADDLTPEMLEAIRRHDKRFKIKRALREMIYFGRVFGVRHVLLEIASDDPEYYEKPFNLDGVTPGSYRGITQIDPYWITPVLTEDSANNPASRHFYDPTYWTVQGRKIHRSHFIIFKGPEVADILKPTYRYGGVSVAQMIFERVYAAERTANEAPQLAQTKRETVLKTDVKKALANQGAFDATMQSWANTRDNYGVRVIGLDDEATQIETSLADLDATIMTQYQLVAAVAGVPITKLLGTVPKGFNATGEYDEASYHETLESLQEAEPTELLERHYACLARSEIEPRFKVRPELTPVWEPLDSMTAKEQAEVNEIEARTGLTLVQSGAIDGMDERARITADPKSGYNGLPTPEPEELLDDGDTPAATD